MILLSMINRFRIAIQFGNVVLDAEDKWVQVHARMKALQESKDIHEPIGSHKICRPLQITLVLGRRGCDRVGSSFASRIIARDYRVRL